MPRFDLIHPANILSEKSGAETQTRCSVNMVQTGGEDPSACRRTDERRGALLELVDIRSGLGNREGGRRCLPVHHQSPVRRRAKRFSGCLAGVFGRTLTKIYFYTL